jgi:hypothetical protein
MKVRYRKKKGICPIEAATDGLRGMKVGVA